MAKKIISYKIVYKVRGGDSVNMESLGIIAAMDEEREEILKIMKNIQKERHFDKEFMIGEIKNTKCILAKSGVGKVNSARTTQLMIDKFDVDSIINVGSAGALNDELNYGDIIISTSCIQHDFDITCFNHPKGYITDIGVEIKADEKLIEKVENASKKIDKRVNVVKGIIATGDQFYNSPKVKRDLRKLFNAECDDMEGAAIAQVCMLCNKPFVVVRSISDKPKSEEKVDFYEYLNIASKRCAEILYEALD